MKKRNEKDNISANFAIFSGSKINKNDIAYASDALLHCAQKSHSLPDHAHLIHAFLMEEQICIHGIGGAQARKTALTSFLKCIAKKAVLCNTAFGDNDCVCM